MSQRIGIGIANGHFRGIGFLCPLERFILNIELARLASPPHAQDNQNDQYYKGKNTKAPEYSFRFYTSSVSLAAISGIL